MNLFYRRIFSRISRLNERNAKITRLAGLNGGRASITVIESFKYYKNCSIELIVGSLITIRVLVTRYSLQD